MATYKVLQDIEAEDKLLGPLTLKQCIFAIIFLAIGFIEFKLATTTALSVVRWPFVIGLIPPMIVFGFLAAPISRDQPNDIWLLARIRFLVKPHVRIWNQDGISELVTITAPKKVEQRMTNGLEQDEVKSRLTALASTLDSRGWAVKNIDVNVIARPDYLQAQAASDRLVAPSTLTGGTAVMDIRAADDILDASNNPVAQHLDEMVQEATKAHHEKIMESFEKAKKVQAAKDATPTPQPAPAAPMQASAPLAAPVLPPMPARMPAPTPMPQQAAAPTPEEIALMEKIKADHAHPDAYRANMKTLQPLSHTSPSPFASAGQSQQISHTQPSTNTSSPAIINLANNDDLNVATLARQAKRMSEDDGEVTISLH